MKTPGTVRQGTQRDKVGVGWVDGWGDPDAPASQRNARATVRASWVLVGNGKVGAPIQSSAIRYWRVWRAGSPSISGSFLDFGGPRSQVVL